MVRSGSTYGRLTPVRGSDPGRGSEFGTLRLFAIVVALGISAAAQPPPPAPADPWTQFRGSPSLTGPSEATLPQTLKLLWTYEAGDAIESSAAIAAGGVDAGAR